MNQIIEQMLKQHDTESVFDKKNSIKEIIQEIVLSGLSRAGFFKVAAFYGGTALRIFYGLDRFSEDLDFSLKISDSSFVFSKHLPILGKEIRSYGLNFKLETKEKSIDSDNKSAFLKGNTKEYILLFFADENLACSIGSNELIKVKFEVDTNPPDHAMFEIKYRLLPIPYEITIYDMPSLFAGKIHAVLFRSWKNRVKGRDLYDYLFYISRNSTVNFEHLNARLAQTNSIPENRQITLEELKEMLRTRFLSIDYSLAKQDILPFIRNPEVLEIWNADFFCQITEGLK